MAHRVPAVAFNGTRPLLLDVAATRAPARSWAVTIGSSESITGRAPTGADTPRTREARVRLAASLSTLELASAASIVVTSPAGEPSVEALAVIGLDGALLHAALRATGNVTNTSQRCTVVCADVGLSGALRPSRGVYATVMAAQTLGIDRLIVANASYPDAAQALADGAACHVISVENVAELARVLDDDHAGIRVFPRRKADEATTCDFADGHVTPEVARVLTIAAAGGHTLLIGGAPGSDALFLARRLVGILAATAEERTAASVMHSLAGLGPISTSPFRAPHHTVSDAGLLGGGWPARPGELSLAHGGVLMLDEIAEFRARTLDAVWRAVREGVATAARVGCVSTFAARPRVIVGTTTACICGRGDCSCAAHRREGHVRRLYSLCGRVMDLQIELPPFRMPVEGATRITTAELLDKVQETRMRLAEVDPDVFVPLSREAMQAMVNTRHFAKDAAAQTARRAAIRRVATTIAALDRAPEVTAAHVTEAATYRYLDDAATQLPYLDTAQGAA